MKYYLVFLISIYQNLFSPIIKQILGVNRMCRFNPTCSAYAKNAICEDGIIRGSKKSIARLLKCQPFFEK